jgi:hypothetical protein
MRRMECRWRLGAASCRSERPAPDGVVRATHQNSGDDPGNYTIVAIGDRGTSVRGTFIVAPG